MLTGKSCTKASPAMNLPRGVAGIAQGLTLLVVVAGALGCESGRSATPIKVQDDGCHEADGGRGMTRDELTKRLGTRSNKDEDELAAEIEARARQEIQMLVDIWFATSDRDVESGAGGVAGRLAELSIGPMIEAPFPEDPDRRRSLINRAGYIELELRKRLMVHLDKLLDDKRFVSFPPANWHGEQKPPKRRVCDEAYLQMWNLTHFGASVDEQSAEQRRFFGQPDRHEFPTYDGRDADIKKARTSRAWRNAMGWTLDAMDAAEAAEKPAVPPEPWR